MSILHVTPSRVCLYLLNIYHFTYTFSHHDAHTEAHTRKHTCTISTQEEWRQLGTGAWLGRAEERLLLKTKALHTHTPNKKMSGKTDIHESKNKKRFEHIGLPAKLLENVLQSNTSNINQSTKAFSSSKQSYKARLFAME